MNAPAALKRASRPALDETQSHWIKIVGMVIRGYLPLFSATVFAGMGMNLCSIAAAGISAWLVGSAVTGRPAADLVPGLWMLAALVLPLVILPWLETTLAHIFAFHVLADMREKLYNAFERLAPGYILDRPAGDLGTAVHGRCGAAGARLFPYVPALFRGPDRLAGGVHLDGASAFAAWNGPVSFFDDRLCHTHLDRAESRAQEPGGSRHGGPGQRASVRHPAGHARGVGLQCQAVAVFTFQTIRGEAWPGADGSRPYQGLAGLRLRSDIGWWHIAHGGPRPRFWLPEGPWTPCSCPFAPRWPPHPYYP